MKAPFLTIGMIVKNEEKVLRRCLDSLVPIMEALPCELLITDTGSTDKTVEIAKEYTDKISYFEWSGDFSAARNVGISKAKGKWFMMFDADQWFDDVSSIIDFFKGKEHEKFKAASVVSRNYVDSRDRGKYTESTYVIFYKIYQGMRFKGKIHENIPVDLNTHKTFPIICHHTGYDYTDDLKKRTQKHERNLSPLIAEYEENPEKIRTLDHLIKQYKGMDEILLAKKYIEKAYNLIKDSPKELYFSLMYKHMCALKETERNYEEAIYLATKYLENRVAQDDIDMDFYIIRSKNYMNLGKADEAIENINKYLVLYEACQNGTLQKSESVIDKAENNILFSYVFAKINLANCYLFNKQESDFTETVNSFQGDEIGLDHIKILIIKPMEYGKANSDFDLVARLLERILIAVNDHEDERVKASVNFIEDYLLKNPEIFNDLTKAFAKVESNHIYFKLMKLRALDIEDKIESAEQILKELMLLDINKNLYLGDLVYYIVKLDYNASDFMESINENNLGIITSNLAIVHKDLYDILISNISDIKPRDISLKDQLFTGMLLEQILINVNKLSRENATSAFNVYINWMKNLLNSVYKLSILDNSMAKILSPGYRFIYYAVEAINAKEANDKLKYIKLLKEGVTCYPPMSNVIKIVLDNFENEEEQRPKSEFEQYAVAVKAKIIELLDMGMRTEVEPLIEAYEKVNPHDSDLHELKNRAGLLN